MYNPVSEVAKIYKFDETEFVKFAIDNEDKYGIIVEYNNVPEVGTWYVDSLIKDFRKLKESTN